MLSYNFIILFLVNILRIFLLKTVMDRVFFAGGSRRNLRTIALCVYCVLMTAVYGIFQISVIYEVCNFLGIAGISICYKEAWKKRLWVTLTLLCMDMACSLAVFSVFGKEGQHQQAAIAAMLLLFCVTVIRHISGQHDKGEIAFDRRQTVLLIMIPFASILITGILMLEESGRTSVLLICSCTLVINISVFYLYNILLESSITLRDNAIYRQQTHAYQNQLELIMESQSRLRALRHDLKNHILALSALLQKNQIKEAAVYLDAMQHFMTNPQEYAATGNDTIDSLLNYKLQKANEILHSVETKIRIPEKLQLQSFDLNVVLGNLLDNAIEASRQTEEKELKINLSLDKGVLFINISNSCQRIGNGKKVIWGTAKMDRDNHGIGLKNVRRIVEKYHGDMELSYKDGRMDADIMMYVRDL